MPLIHTLFERQAKLIPEETSLIFGDRKATYSQLNSMADNIASAILQRRLSDSELVPVFMERSIEMIAAVIGVLKAGFAYVPIDPNYPKQRIAFMLESSKANRIILSEHLDQRLPDLLQEKFIFGQNLGLNNKLAETTRAEVLQDDNSLAYVIFTSGSTGQPKGVSVHHGALTNLLEWQNETLPAPPGERTLQFTSLSFDVSFQEIFSTLCYGGCLVLVDEETRRDPKSLWKHIEDWKINRIYLPFVALQQLSDAFEHSSRIEQALKHVITAGEQLQATDSIKALFKALPNTRLHNHYGPSETHVVTAHTLSEKVESWPSLPPIGKAIANSEVLFIDEDGNVADPSSGGEMWLGGACVGQGYFQRDDLTNERFISKGGIRYYKTGDLGKALPNGDIQFLGRIDGQVKIRGHRVELGEIESRLSSHPSVLECAVSTFERGSERVLTAYIVSNSDQEWDIHDLKAYLRQDLAEYMIPSSFVSIERLPTTPSGKLDRKSLPLPDFGDTGPSANYIAPKEGLEETIAEVWSRVLEIRWVGSADNFFDIGGTSISIAKVHDELTRTLQREIATPILFQYPTISVLASYLENGNEPSRKTKQRANRATMARKSLARAKAARLNKNR